MTNIEIDITTQQCADQITIITAQRSHMFSANFYLHMRKWITLV
jgi:hypothetical protein